jgi:hypothetical protein
VLSTKQFVERRADAKEEDENLLVQTVLVALPLLGVHSLFGAAARRLRRELPLLPFRRGAGSVPPFRAVQNDGALRAARAVNAPADGKHGPGKRPRIIRLKSC